MRRRGTEEEEEEQEGREEKKEEWRKREMKVGMGRKMMKRKGMKMKREISMQVEAQTPVSKREGSAFQLGGCGRECGSVAKIGSRRGWPKWTDGALQQQQEQQ